MDRDSGSSDRWSDHSILDKIAPKSQLQGLIMRGLNR